MRALIAIALLLALTDTALAGSWTSRTETGVASGQEKCVVSSPGSDVFVLYLKTPDVDKPLVSVSVGYKNYPGVSVYLLVGDQRFQTAESFFMGDGAMTILAAMRVSSNLAFEWTEWPGREKHEGRVPLGDVGRLLDQCEDWLGKP